MKKICDICKSPLDDFWVNYGPYKYHKKCIPEMPDKFAEAERIIEKCFEFFQEMARVGENEGKANYALRCNLQAHKAIAIISEYRKGAGK